MEFSIRSDNCLDIRNPAEYLSRYPVFDQISGILPDIKLNIRSYTSDIQSSTYKRYNCVIKMTLTTFPVLNKVKMDKLKKLLTQIATKKLLSQSSTDPP